MLPPARDWARGPRVSSVPTRDPSKAYRGLQGTKGDSCRPQDPSKQLRVVAAAATALPCLPGTPLARDTQLGQGPTAIPFQSRPKDPRDTRLVQGPAAIPFQVVHVATTEVAATLAHARCPPLKGHAAGQ